METRTVCFDLPVGAFSALRKTPDELTKDMRLIAAVKWYETGQVSQEKAAEIAGITREDFLMALSKLNVSPFQYTAREILTEAGYE